MMGKVKLLNSSNLIQKIKKLKFYKEFILVGFLLGVGDPCKSVTTDRITFSETFIASRKTACCCTIFS